MVFFIKYLAVAEYPETEKTFYRVRDFQILAFIFFLEKFFAIVLPCFHP